MNTCFFVSDLHGMMSRYEALFKIIRREKPDFVFLGGDLLPHFTKRQDENNCVAVDFVNDFLIRKFHSLKEKMDCTYPDVFLIPGNDDQKIIFRGMAEGEKADLWRNLHNHCIVIGKYRFYGYAFVPPTPFRIKDWDKYDISDEMEEGCVAPAAGYHSVSPDFDPANSTIQNDLEILTKEDNLDFGVFLFHSPPYNTLLDQAETRYEYRKAVGSRAIRSFIEQRQPYISMHGHIHESARISGAWRQNIGRTELFSAAHDGSELALITFELQNPSGATRRLIKT